MTILTDHFNLKEYFK